MKTRRKAMKLTTLIVFMGTFLKLSRSKELASCLIDIVTNLVQHGDYIGFYNFDSEFPKGRPLTLTTMKDHTSTILSSLTRNPNASVLMYSKDLKPLKPIKQKRVYELPLYFIWFSTFNIEQLVTTLHTIKTYRIFGPKTRLFIVIEMILTGEELDRIFGTLWLHIRGFYSTILVSENNKVLLYSFDPPKETVTWSEINAWDGNFVNDRFFSRMPHDFEGYNFLLGYFPRDPYVILPAKEGAPPTGLEITMARTIIHKLNMSITFVTPPANEDPSQIFDEEKYTGVCGLLNRFDVDLLCSGTGVIMEGYTSSSPLLPWGIDDLVFILPRPSREENWKSLFKAFSLATWLAIFAVIIVTTMALYIKKISGISSPPLAESFFMVMGFHFEQGISHTTMAKISKLILTFIFFYSLIITTCYKSIFTTLITIPAVPVPPTTLQEAADTGLTFYFVPVYKMIVNQTEHDIWSEILSPGRHIYNYNRTLHYEKTAIDRTGISVSAKHTYKIAFDQFFSAYGGASLVIDLPYKFYTLSTSMVLSPGNPFYSLFEERQNWLIEMGLLDHWLDDMHFMNSLKNKEISNDDVDGMTLSELLAVFYLVLILWIISLFLCLGEILIPFLLNRVLPVAKENVSQSSRKLK